MGNIFSLFLGGAGKFLLANVFKIFIGLTLAGAIGGAVYFVVTTIKENTELKETNKKLEHNLSLLKGINKDNVDQSEKDGVASGITIDAVGKDADNKKKAQEDTGNILSDLDRKEKDILEGKPKVELKMSKDPIVIKKTINPISKLIVKNDKPAKQKEIIIKPQETTVVKNASESLQDFQLSEVRYDALWESYCKASNDVKSCQAV